jgi:hypothetical protein
MAALSSIPTADFRTDQLFEHQQARKIPDCNGQKALAPLGYRGEADIHPLAGKGLGEGPRASCLRAKIRRDPFPTRELDSLFGGG